MMISSMLSWLRRRISTSFRVKNEKGVDNIFMRLDRDGNFGIENEKGVDNLWKGGYNKSEQNIKNEKDVNNPEVNYESS